MEMMIRRHTDREAQQMHAHREELVERIARAIPADGAIEPLPGLRLNRISAPVGPVYSVLDPAFCVIAQGSKEILVGESRFRYDPAAYLLATVELPTVNQVIEASPSQPYLSLRLTLDPTLVGSVMVDAGCPMPRGHVDVRAVDVSVLDAGLLDATVRLLRLLDSPADARFLQQSVTRETVYRLLGTQAERLRHIAALGGYTRRIAEAVGRMRRDFDQPQRIEVLAHELSMSVSSFHHHFKAVTALSPLQFQKQLRLQEARRLMLSEDLDAGSAGRRVGYNDAAHFNRDYKGLFGAPPLRDMLRLRTAAKESAAV